jgi:acyl-CoA thioesterase-1
MMRFPLRLLLLVLCCRCVFSPCASAADTSVSPSGTFRIVFLGDSLTAGLGLPEDEAYPAIIQQKLRQRSAGQPQGKQVEVINAGISGDTSAGGLHRLDWLSKQPIDILFLALGANDGLRGLDPQLTKANLKAIIEKTRARFPAVKIILAGMLVPPNMGKSYADEYQRIFPELAKEEHTLFLPFLLAGVAGNPKLNQADGIHPTAEGQKIIAENVWKVLEPLMDEP